MPDSFEMSRTVEVSSFRRVRYIVDSDLERPIFVRVSLFMVYFGLFGFYSCLLLDT